MVENITSLTSVSFSDPYVGHVLLAILIGVTIMLFTLKEIFLRLDKRVIRFQQVYADWLEPDVIKLNYDEEREVLRYTKQYDPKWQDFIRVVNRQMKRHRYKAWGLYEGVEKAGDELKLIITEIASAFIDICNKGGLNFKFEEKWGKNNFVIPKLVALCIGSLPLDEENGSDEAYTLSYGTKKIAKTDSETEKNKLKDLIQSMVEDDEVKELIANRDQTEKDVKQAKDMYNNQLAEVIRDFRLYPRKGIST